MLACRSFPPPCSLTTDFQRLSVGSCILDVLTCAVAHLRWPHPPFPVATPIVCAPGGSPQEARLRIIVCPLLCVDLLLHPHHGDPGGACCAKRTCRFYAAPPPVHRSHVSPFTLTHHASHRGHEPLGLQKNARYIDNPRLVRAEFEHM